MESYSLDNMPVLVTSTGGFIRRLVEALAGRGARVRAFVRTITPECRFAKNTAACGSGPR